MGTFALRTRRAHGPQPRRAGSHRARTHRVQSHRAEPHPARTRRTQPDRAQLARTRRTQPDRAQLARTRRTQPGHARSYRAWRTQHRDRLGAALPGLFGPSRRAAWRRFVLRRVLAAALIAVGLALAFFAGMTTAPRP